LHEEKVGSARCTDRTPHPGPANLKKQGRGFIRVPVAALFCDYLISVKEQCYLPNVLKNELPD